MLSCQSNIKIVATILAKNEEDIIGRNIEHHIKQGVSQIIVTDNNSTDRTREIAASYPEVVEIIDEPGEDHHQSLWVTRMAREACKLNPDWIVHLDADELWCGLSSLRRIQASTVGCVKMFLHPPAKDQSPYMSFENVKWLPGECKVAHRPDPEIEITHGNHGFEGRSAEVFTKSVWRHHYPVRSYEQFERKTIQGHRALVKRNAICERWHGWYQLCMKGELRETYDAICQAWQNYLETPNLDDLNKLLSFWSTEEVIEEFQRRGTLPETGWWPSKPSREKNPDYSSLRML